MDEIDKLLRILPYPFQDVLTGGIGNIRRAHFIVEAGDLKMVRMIGDGTGRQKERCAFLGLSFAEKDLPAIRELFAWMKRRGIGVEVLKVPKPRSEDESQRRDGELEKDLA